MNTVEKFIRKTLKGDSLFFVCALISLTFFWFVIQFIKSDSLKLNLEAGIIIMVFTVLVGGKLLRICYPPPSKTMSRFLIPQLNYHLFSYLRDLGFLMKYQFDNTGFKGMSSIDFSTYDIFIKKNLKSLMNHIENRNNTKYTRAELRQMNSMFRTFYNVVNEFTTRYANHLDDGVLNSLYEIRHICEYGDLYTAAFSREGEPPDELVCMAENISNKPMRDVLILIENIMTKIEGNAVLKTDPLTI
ncbi:MAG: hypothetical protein KJ880_02880 [Candidatus Omnitrophica bacterium]|nr:hypothetical protein [Candidatus Omnitrophota bacterium]